MIKPHDEWFFKVNSHSQSITQGLIKISRGNRPGYDGLMGLLRWLELEDEEVAASPDFVVNIGAGDNDGHSAATQLPAVNRATRLQTRIPPIGTT
jgi:hypothetical protein